MKNQVRGILIVERRSQGEIEFVLDMVEQMVRGHDSYFKVYLPGLFRFVVLSITMFGFLM